MRTDLAAALRTAGFTSEGDAPLRQSDLIGRRPLFDLRLAGERYVLRRYSHGGLLRWLTGARFLDPGRPFRELALAHELTLRGVRTPEVVAARARRARGGGWRLDLVTRRIEDALDLAQALAFFASARSERPTARSTLASAGALVRGLHECGFLHADLTPRNLLLERSALEGGEPRWWILDLDRSSIVPDIGAGRRCDNLRRLFRHVARLARERSLTLGRADLLAFLRGYERDPRARKALWRKIERGHERWALPHRAGWWLERKLAGRRTVPPPPAQTDARTRRA